MLLDTPRLQLRRWRDSDAEPFARLNADPAVMEYLPNPLTRAESDALIARMEAHHEQNGFGAWAVERKGTGQLIGFAGLSRPSFDTHFTPCVEIGWRLAHAFWGQGYATEAAQAALAFGFGEAQLPEIVSFTVPANRRSIAVMERLGMRREGTFDHPRVPDGHPLRQHVLYRLSKSSTAV